MGIARAPFVLPLISRRSGSYLRELRWDQMPYFASPVTTAGGVLSVVV